MSTVPLSLTTPVPALWRAFVGRLALRWRQAQETTLTEIVMFLFAFDVGMFNSRWPGGYTQGWAQLGSLEVFGLNVTQERFGNFLLVVSIVQFAAIFSGHKWLRLGVCYVAGMSSGIVTALVWRANPLSPIIPYTGTLCLVRGLLIGRISKVEARGHGGG